MSSISVVFPYYENPMMLEHQLRHWAFMDESLRGNIELIIVDDGSPKFPAREVIEDSGLPFLGKLFRIQQNIPWNQHGARNLGAQQASNPWLFMTDIDIVIPQALIYRMVTIEPNHHHHFTFERKFAGGVRPDKVHCNTFLVRKDVYWQVGGYDEDYCGTYGGDGPFMRQLEAIAPNILITGTPLIGYERQVIGDANTTEWDRDGPMKEAYRNLLKQKNSTGNTKAKNPIRFDWERVL